MEVKPLCCPVELSEGIEDEWPLRPQQSAEFYLIFLAIVKLKKNLLYLSI